MSGVDLKNRAHHDIVQVVTDASKEGWGGTVEGQKV